MSKQVTHIDILAHLQGKRYTYRNFCAPVSNKLTHIENLTLYSALIAKRFSVLPYSFETSAKVHYCFLRIARRKARHFSSKLTTREISMRFPNRRAISLATLYISSALLICSFVTVITVYPIARRALRRRASLAIEAGFACKLLSYSTTSL